MKTIEKKTPEALECKHILGTTAEQVVVKWSNARPGGINFRQMPAYTEVIVSQMPGGCPGGGMIAVGFDSYIIIIVFSTKFGMKLGF
jgi:hypothetical protein